MRYLAIDYGSRRLGLALSDPLGITAQPLPPVLRQGNRKDAAAVAAVAAENGVTAFVLGLPLLEDGNEGDTAAKARRFGEVLAETAGLPVEYWDERFSTAQAERHLVESGVRREKRKELRDGLSAALFLQSFLDAGRRGTP
jgi:putative Holliday junction resolvase